MPRTACGMQPSLTKRASVPSLAVAIVRSLPHRQRAYQDGGVAIVTKLVRNLCAILRIACAQYAYRTLSRIRTDIFTARSRE